MQQQQLQHHQPQQQQHQQELAAAAADPAASSAASGTKNRKKSGATQEAQRSASASAPAATASAAATSATRRRSNGNGNGNGNGNAAAAAAAAAVSSAGSDEELYCLCKKPYDSSLFMIECNVCHDWFHGECVNVTPAQADSIDKYHCPACANTHGPSKAKRKKVKKPSIFGRPAEESDSDSEANLDAALQPGRRFVDQLKSKAFAPMEQCVVVEEAAVVTPLYFATKGFSKPLLFRSSAGLDMMMPPPSFTVQDVLEHVGSSRKLDVMDVATQKSETMTMGAFAAYFQTPAAQRDRILNLISLEFSKTKLAKRVSAPRVVREVDWIDVAWPRTLAESKPQVQLYCLMGVANSYTDFHIDFGGTSVWYHVLRGKKIFLLYPATSRDLGKGHLDAGSKTMFIQTGWIHAVYTPEDSLVFGGNFLHYYGMDMQMRVYDIERRINVPKKFTFPRFEALSWYAANCLLLQWNAQRYVPSWIVPGLRGLVEGLSNWISKKTCMENVPADICPQAVVVGLAGYLDVCNALLPPSAQATAMPTMIRIDPIQHNQIASAQMQAQMQAQNSFLQQSLQQPQFQHLPQQQSQHQPQQQPQQLLQLSQQPHGTSEQLLFQQRLQTQQPSQYPQPQFFASRSGPSAGLSVPQQQQQYPFSQQPLQMAQHMPMKLDPSLQFNQLQQQPFQSNSYLTHQPNQMLQNYQTQLQQQPPFFGAQQHVASMNNSNNSSSGNSSNNSPDPNLVASTFSRAHTAHDVAAQLAQMHEPRASRGDIEESAAATLAALMGTHASPALSQASLGPSVFGEAANAAPHRVRLSSKRSEADESADNSRLALASAGAGPTRLKLTSRRQSENGSIGSADPMNTGDESDGEDTPRNSESTKLHLKRENVKVRLVRPRTQSQTTAGTTNLDEEAESQEPADDEHAEKAHSDDEGQTQRRSSRRSSLPERSSSRLRPRTPLTKQAKRRGKSAGDSDSEAGTAESDEDDVDGAADAGKTDADDDFSSESNGKTSDKSRRATRNATHQDKKTKIADDAAESPASPKPDTSAPTTTASSAPTTTTSTTTPTTGSAPPAAGSVPTTTGSAPPVAVARQNSSGSLTGNSSAQKKPAKSLDLRSKLAQGMRMGRI
ncbi:hypothetical protein CAOG_002306 [Capsaspora owczarzaki ATCC 30864]|uniref:Uncharacterized protein n=1 Tax=Capsaspora owczarzaki (strain ATCC 30864) TaxID=595528 RepID=A0A0D2VM09_CAPO3|nr:hypothetical protein CAOG_002306 [Capsaspora owczarzaki ATCC 30864]